MRAAAQRYALCNRKLPKAPLAVGSRERVVQSQVY